MPKRRRYATRPELVSLLVDRMNEVPFPPADVDEQAYLNRVLLELEQLGVRTDTLVRITVDEPPLT